MSDERGQNRISPMDGQKDRSVWLFMGLGFVVSGTPGCSCTGFLCQGWAIECVATCLFGRVNGLLYCLLFKVVDFFAAETCISPCTRRRPR